MELARHCSCLDLNKLQVVGVLGNVDRSGLKVVGVLERDEVLLLEEKERAALVGGVVGNGNLDVLAASAASQSGQGQSCSADGSENFLHNKINLSF